MRTTSKLLLTLAATVFSVTACVHGNDVPVHESDAKYVGQVVGNFTADEWYPGGRLGTTENVTEGCYEDEAPAVVQQGLENAFNHGEMFFERNVTLNTAPFRGLGPASVRKSCLD
ncbi:MAG: hypothetical protein K6E61_01415, partial [Bacteroidales bacterium]|nr:hypothetical protein [Bacteroidales bacterium]